MRDYYTGDIVWPKNYYPFGAALPGRSTGSSDYRYGFNNQEKIDEVYGEGNYLDFEYRGYNPRLGRFFAVDPLAAKFPYWTPYQFAGNTPIEARELEGLETWHTTTGETEPDPGATGGGPVREQVGPMEPAAAAQDYGYSQYGVMELDNNFSTDKLSEVNDFCGTNNSDDCYVTWRNIASIMFDKPEFANLSWTATNSISDRSYESGNIKSESHLRLSINSDGIYMDKLTDVISSKVEGQTGLFGFEVQINSGHLVSVLYDNITDPSNPNYYLIDQGTQPLTNNSSLPRSVISADELNSIVQQGALVHRNKYFPDRSTLTTKVWEFSTGEKSLHLNPIEE